MVSGTRKRYQRSVLVASALALAIAVSLATAASVHAGIKNRLEIGSILIEITQGSPAALVGLATSANQGLEKTITYQLAKLAPTDTSVVIPLFLLAADVDESSNHAVFRNIDTLLFLTNGNPVGGSSVTVQVTFRNGNGAALNNPAVYTIGATQTAVISAISTLNP